MERNLRNREHEILFMDLRQWTENAVKGESKKKVRLDTEQIEKAADIYHTWQCEETDGAAMRYQNFTVVCALMKLKVKVGLLHQANTLSLLTMI